jgi:DNA-binding NtrC family response regulator
VPELSPAAAAVLSGYAWPGNVRELRNTIERALILWPAPRLEPAAFPERIAGKPAAGPQLGGDATLDEIEREHILRVVARSATLDDRRAHPRDRRVDAISEAEAVRKRRREPVSREPVRRVRGIYARSLAHWLTGSRAHVFLPDRQREPERAPAPDRAVDADRAAVGG